LRAGGRRRASVHLTYRHRLSQLLTILELPLTIEDTGLTPPWSWAMRTTRLAPDNSNFLLAYDDAQVQ